MAETMKGLTGDGEGVIFDRTRKGRPLPDGSELFAPHSVLCGFLGSNTKSLGKIDPHLLDEAGLDEAVLSLTAGRKKALLSRGRLTTMRGFFGPNLAGP
jgi:hypothetical protein